HLSEVVGPFHLGCELSRLPSVGRVHEFDVLQMVLSRAIRRRRHALAYVSAESQSEFLERGKEVIVSRLLPRPPVAHRPCVNYLVVKNVIAVRAPHRRLGRVALT